VSSSKAAAVVVLVIVCLAGCGSGGRHSTATSATEQPPPARLTDSHPCPGIPGFTCASLVAQLDHAGETGGTLHLAVGVQSRTRAPRGVLVLLAGGPGQPGVALLRRIQQRLGAALDGYRLVMFDQRGTGAGALRCPALQAAAGSSDLVVPPLGAVAACANAIGPDRRYYTTAETVADLEQLRVALGVERITLDGVSYGSFVAERYALTHPTHVARLVLDSVVPQQGVDPLYLASLQATAGALRSACAEARCGFDPASDLATVVRARHDGPQLLNGIVAESIVAPAFPHVLAALHAAAGGDLGPLNGFLAAVHDGEAAPAYALSQGLHESTLCLDLPAPWNPQASPAQRLRVLSQQPARLPATAFFPYDRATAPGNGIGQGCAQWPSTTPPALPYGDPAARLPAIPVLLLNGARDLSTPVAWAREEATDAPDGHLIVVPDAGHSVQTKDPAYVEPRLKQFLDG
jgi:pimeloyl-ACP methyl ester carboxylesterase